MKALPLIHQPDRVAPNAGDVQQLIGHINTREKIRLFFFSTVLLRVFSGPEIPVYHRSLCDKKFYHSECLLTEHEPRHIADGQVQQR